MFSDILNPGANKEIKAQKEFRKEDTALIREQTAMKVAADASGDHAYALEQDAKSDLLKWQQDLSDDLQEMIMTLKNYILNDEGKWIAIKTTAMREGKIVTVEKRPLCNDRFIYEVVVPQCKPFFSRNLINSDFDIPDVLNMLRNTVDDITDVMADGYLDYAIKFTDFDTVLRVIKNAIRPAPYRAVKGWTKKIDSTQMRRVEAFTEAMQSPQKDKSLFGLFKQG